MKVDSEKHLNETQIIQAVVDVADLPAAVRDHLAECSHCFGNKEKFAQELTNLGQLAEDYAPKPQRRIKLPIAETKHNFWRSFSWRNVVAATATVAAVFLIVWGTGVVRNYSKPGTQNLAQEMLEAEQLMTEINALVDNALPSFYLELSGDKRTDDAEEFYQFLIPSVEKT